MSERLILASPPAQEPSSLSLDIVKQWLKISYTDDDGLISGLITTARMYAETVTRQQFVTATYTLYADSFYNMIREHKYETPSPLPLWGSIWLPKPPIQTMISVQYMQPDGTFATWDPSQYTISYGIPSRISPTFGRVFPILSRIQNDNVVFTYTTGYDDLGATVPQNYIHACLAMIHRLYEERTSCPDEKTLLAFHNMLAANSGEFGCWI